MREQGKLVTWHDDRGFGFIEPDAGGPDVFLHIKAFPAGAGRPQTGLRLSYETERNREGKLRARAVRIEDRSPAQAVGQTVAKLGVHRSPGRMVLAGFLVLYLLVHLVWGVPGWVHVLYLGASVLCFGFYAVDKSAAQDGRLRIREKTLLLLGLACGWPGAVIAQEGLRHKSGKVPFRRVFWASVAANVAGFLLVCTPLFSAVL